MGRADIMGYSCAIVRQMVSCKLIFFFYGFGEIGGMKFFPSAFGLGGGMEIQLTINQFVGYASLAFELFPPKV